MPAFETPGVFIVEQTGPGVIAGVGTSTAGFIGPTNRGPILKPRRVSSFDEFLSIFAARDQNSQLDPYIKAPKTVYLAHAVRGFFENGGRQAFIVRIGKADATAWEVKNRNTPTPETLFKIEALDPGPNSGIKITITESHLADGIAVATGKSQVSKVDTIKKTVQVANGKVFRVGDKVTKAGPGATTTAEVLTINGNELELTEVPVAVNDDLRIADLIPTQVKIRMASTTGLFPGSLVNITDSASTEPALIEKVDAAGFVTFVNDSTRFPVRAKTFGLGGNPPTLTSYEFDLTVTPKKPFEEEIFRNLSLESVHARFAPSAVRSKLIRIMTPVPPPLNTLLGRQAKDGDITITRNGTEVDLNALNVDHYKEGLKALDKVDEVNLVCVPDAAALHSDQAKEIQRAMIDGCVAIQDRFALLDSRPGADSENVEQQRKDVQSDRGFAALYYPWLEVRDPTSVATPPLTMFIPPCGHMAGVYARTDQERGVHKAPANTEVRGILGLERLLSDGEQGPLNLKGINVLRIFPGSNTVVVWGARTTVDPAISDWLYVNVRRLLLFIEESIEEGIRPAVFEPNAPPLWKALKRTITQFLTQVWRDGGLFGDTPDQAFRVRIDEGLNPPSERARGRLFIEIRVAPVRPAEFIVVRIGLFDGGAEVQEG
jgi:uncharacterized protein